MESQESNERQREDTGGGDTSPDESTHDATTPPGSGDIDEDAVSDAKERLEEAGGGH